MYDHFPLPDSQYLNKRTLPEPRSTSLEPKLPTRPVS
jgi:hypothetical protein